MKDLTAKDIMNGDVLFAYEDWSIKYLANFFTDNKITGAPVITTTDKNLLGVVSVTDIFNFENQGIDGKVEYLRDYYQNAYGNDLDISDLKSWSLNAEENCTVQQIMRNQIISVTENESLTNICKTMLDQKIHRVFVTRDKSVVGVISTSDLLRVMSGA